MVITVNAGAKSVTTQFDTEEWDLLVWYNQKTGGAAAEMFKGNVSVLLRQAKEAYVKDTKNQLDLLLKTATPAQIQQIIDLLTP